MSWKSRKLRFRQLHSAAPKLVWGCDSGVTWSTISCDSNFEIANVSHFESLRVLMSNEVYEGGYYARL
jgi:hypothetical protein